MPSLALLDIPADVQSLLEEMRGYMADKDIVDEPSSGLKWQYQNGLLDKDGLEKIVTRQRVINTMIQQGIWKP